MKYALGNMLNGAGGLNADQLSLDLQFATDKTLTARKGPTPVFTRASTATFVGSNGLIQSAAINAARFDHDPVTLVCKGLLIEEGRTNLVFPSDTLTTQTRTVTAVAHTLSFYGAGTVVLSGAATATVTGTGAYPTRTTLTFTPTAGSLIMTVTGSVTQAQLEAGAFPTSYIPTTTASLARSADVCSITGSDFSGFYNPLEGSLFTNTIFNVPPLIGSAQRIWELSSATVVNSSRAFRSTVSGGVGFRSTSSSVTDVSFDTTVIPPSQQIKQSFGFIANNFAFYSNNAEIGIDTLCSIPASLNALYIGSISPTSGGGGQLNGTFASFRYFKKRLPNAKLQTLST
jgi:hypothetical protein